jgi:hypothetical protein
MSWCKALLLALFLLWGIPNAYAQRIEVTPFFGSRFGGTINLRNPLCLLEPALMANSFCRVRGKRTMPEPRI